MLRQLHLRHYWFLINYNVIKYFLLKEAEATDRRLSSEYQYLSSFSTRIHQRNGSEKIFRKSVRSPWPFDFRCFDRIYTGLGFANWTNSRPPRPANRLVLLTWTPRVRACGRALIGGSLLAYIHKTSSIPLGHRLYITAQLSCISSLAFLFHAHAKAVVPFVIIALKPECFKPHKFFILRSRWLRHT